MKYQHTYYKIKMNTKRNGKHVAPPTNITKMHSKSVDQNINKPSMIILTFVLHKSYTKGSMAPKHRR